jgi:branched-chain amino acid transport system ATP-binding protein
VSIEEAGSKASSAKLELRGASAGYGSMTVLRDINIEVRAGSVTALLGPNGAGKTTLLRAASGVLPLQGGDLIIDGRRVRTRRPAQIAGCGICHITEGRSIFDALTVRENIRLFSPKGSRAESAALERVVDAFPRLSSRLSQVAGTMSGGEQQMLALSRAYVRKYDLVMLDEVSLGLAPLVIDQIFGFMRRLADEGTGLLLVEQYVTRALAFAEDVFVLSRGSIVFSGPAASLDRDAAFDRYM